MTKPTLTKDEADKARDEAYRIFHEVEEAFWAGKAKRADVRRAFLATERAELVYNLVS